MEWRRRRRGWRGGAGGSAGSDSVGGSVLLSVLWFGQRWVGDCETWSVSIGIGIGIGIGEFLKNHD